MYVSILRLLFFFFCELKISENTWEWSDKFGHSFRSHDDIYNDWKSVVEILNVHAKVLDRSRPGYWADPGNVYIKKKITLYIISTFLFTLLYFFIFYFLFI